MRRPAGLKISIKPNNERRMPETSISLLNRMQQTDAPESWDRLVGLYGPLLTSWLRKYGVQASDTEDLVQEVLLAVLNDLKSFDHNGRPGAFRTWLRSILVNRLRNFWRARDRRPQVQGDTDIDRQLMELQDRIVSWTKGHQAGVSNDSARSSAAIAIVARDGQQLLADHTAPYMHT